MVKKEKEREEEKRNGRNIICTNQYHCLLYHITTYELRVTTQDKNSRRRRKGNISIISRGSGTIRNCKIRIRRLQRPESPRLGSRS